MLVRVKPLLLASVVALGCSTGGERAGSTIRADKGDIAIVGVTVVPMDRDGTLKDQTVLVRSGRIVEVRPAREIDPGPATVLDGHGKWLVPGLADMHVHINEEGQLPLFPLNGVTVVRDLFGAPAHLRWREAIAKGDMQGPTLVQAGPIMDGDPPTWPGSAVVTTPEAARREVQAQKKAGYDWIKVYNGLSSDVYQAIVAEAKAQGMPVGGHVPKAVGIEAALTSGQ